MTTTATKWTERIREWRASGKTAEEYASTFDFEASTLRYWSSRLKREAGKPVTMSPLMARVVREPKAAETVASSRPSEAASSGADIEVVVGSARIVVRRGFDAKLLREIADALGGTR